MANGTYLKNDLIQKASAKDPGFNLYWLGVALGQISSFDEQEQDFHLLVKPCNFENLKAFALDWQREIAAEMQRRIDDSSHG